MMLMILLNIDFIFHILQTRNYLLLSLISKASFMKNSLIVVFCLMNLLNSRPSTAQDQEAKNQEKLTPGQVMAREIFKELIEINTTIDDGSTRAAEAMAVRLKNAGFPEKDINLIGPEPKHKNLVVRLRGKGIHKPLLFIGHLDVVEALREDWSFDPFTFLEQDGYFYGRGTMDMKGDDAVLIADLIRLKQEGFVPDRDIILALTEGEESGLANGINWLLLNHRELIDAGFCINCDSGGGTIRNGKHSLMTIQTCEKIYFDFQLEVKNKGGHSALPVRDNAIYRLAEAMLRLADYRFPIRMNETTRQFFERNAIQETGQVREDMLAMTKDPVDTEAAERLAAYSPDFNSKLRTTIVATMLSGGHAENALPQTARANINCRMLPEDNPENVMAVLKSVVNDPQVTITYVKTNEMAPRSPLRDDVVKPLESLTREMWPGVIVSPVMSNGASDGKYLRIAGIPVYGVSGIFNADDNRAHGRDERIGVKEYYEGLEFMYRYIKLLTSGS
jgi:acetylornithine deacetylase/succinyl-diaminopimelate desuccinylase-like protein